MSQLGIPTSARAQAIIARHVCGRRAEEHVLRVLARGPLPGWVTGFRRATAREDRMGVDVVVYAGDVEIGLQVKSSFFRALEFIRHPDYVGVAVVVSPPSIDDETLLGRIVGLLIVVAEKGLTRTRMRRALLAQRGH